jgi:uncharacterized phage-associated protein
MQQKEKAFYFEYVLFKLGIWYADLIKTEENDFSVLKSLKLLFFVSSCNAKSKEKNILLDSVFDNFYAMPYGHVESDVYNAIRQDELAFYSINTRKATPRSEKQIDVIEFNSTFSKLFKSEINSEILTKIDESINFLKDRNAQFVSYSAFELVELSHLYTSWDRNYKKGAANSILISVEEIKSEMKIFSL